MSYGLTPTGFVAKTSEIILHEIEADQLANVDATLDLSPDQPLGQFNGIFAAELAEAWEVLATIYGGLDPDNAEDAQLDRAMALTGTTRLAPKKSSVSCTVNLDASKTFAPGTMTANVAGQPSRLFRNRNVVTSVGAGNYTATFESADYGPVPAPAGTLTVITVAVTGWNSITNPLDATLGRLSEQDAPARTRRKIELTRPGASTVDAIRADLLDPDQVPGVIAAVVLENTGLTVDVNGQPGKSIQAIIWDGIVPAASDTKIAQAIWNGKAGGIEAYGTTTANAIDSLGTVRPVKFSRATQRTIYLSYVLVKDASKYPSDGDAQLKAAAVAAGNALTMGDDVIALKFRAIALTIPGVIDVTTFTLDFTAVPVPSVNLPIAQFEKATFDTSRITVA